MRTIRPTTLAATGLALTWLAGAALSRTGPGTGRYPTQAGVDTVVWSRFRAYTVPELEAWSQVTASGGRYVVLSLSLLVAVAVAATSPSARVRAMAVPVSLLAAGASAQLVAKPVLGRHIAHAVDAYPSGHATGAAATALALYLVLRPGPIRCAVAAISGSWAAAVGLGMVATGSHYPTDVLAGWAWGSCWAVLVAAAFDRLARHRAQTGGISAGASPAGSRCSSSPRSPAGSC